MRVLVLGSAAGGGFPQWNCTCRTCTIARTDPSRAHPRTQSSVAIQAPTGHWFLVNVSPDVQTQIERFGLTGSSVHAESLRDAVAAGPPPCPPPASGERDSAALIAGDTEESLRDAVAAGPPPCPPPARGERGTGRKDGGEVGRIVGEDESAGVRVTEGRGSAIDAALITNADLDHSLGLFSLREDKALRVFARPPVRAALTDGLGLEQVLANYCGVEWHDVPLNDAPLRSRDGTDTGLTIRAIPARGGRPRYFPGGRSDHHDDSVGFLISDTSSHKSVLILPDVEQWTEEIQTACESATLVLFDGTFWSENELIALRPTALPASKMGHMPISGPEGSLRRLAAIPGVVKAYLHINNTNPILLEDSPERREVEGSGVVVSQDGMSWDLGA